MTHSWRTAALAFLFALTASAHSASYRAYYNQTYFKFVHGSGTTCGEANFEVQQNFSAWAATLPYDSVIARTPGFHHFVTLAKLDARTCGTCAITDSARQTACLASVEVQYFSQTSTAPDGQIRHVGKPHGQAIFASPIFEGRSYGVDCLEAVHHAQVDLFSQLEMASVLYEFQRLERFDCTCSKNTSPRLASCKARVLAYNLDSREP